MYVWIHIGLCMVAWGILLSPPLTGVLTTLSWETQQLLAVCMLSGFSMALTGAAMGARYFFRRIDIRVAYTFGIAGLLSVFVSMATYAWVIATNATLVGTLGGGLTVGIGCGCVHKAVNLVREIRRINRNIATIEGFSR